MRMRAIHFEPSNQWPANTERKKRNSIALIIAIHFRWHQVILLFLAAAIFWISLFCAPITQAQIISAKVSGGEIQGEKVGEIGVFKGIPFAAPPVGPLRWKAPQPVKPWEGVRNATAFAPAPMQYSFGRHENFSEDCLYLNVWTPATNANQKLPVMVWIYGGAFIIGSTAWPSYEGANLAQKGVIVVSVAYRLGAFGFLAHSELTREGGKGNFGLLDQIAGLRWVHDNISALGGDPNQVTAIPQDF